MTLPGAFFNFVGLPDATIKMKNLQAPKYLEIFSDGIVVCQSQYSVSQYNPEHCALEKEIQQGDLIVMKIRGGLYQSHVRRYISRAILQLTSSLDPEEGNSTIVDDYLVFKQTSKVTWSYDFPWDLAKTKPALEFEIRELEGRLMSIDLISKQPILHLLEVGD